MVFRQQFLLFFLLLFVVSALFAQQSTALKQEILESDEEAIFSLDLLPDPSDSQNSKKQKSKKGISEDEAIVTPPSTPKDSSSLEKLPAKPNSPINIYGGIVKREGESSAPISVITSSEIMALGCKNASEAINELPGNLINKTGSRSGINSVSIRGSRSNQVSIMINGVKVNNPLGVGGNDPSRIPVEMIERIEIYRGGASAIGGDGAGVGAVNIVTKLPLKDSYFGGYDYHSIDGHSFRFQISKKLAKSDSALVSGGELLYNPTDINIVGGDVLDNSWSGSFNLNWLKETSKYSLSFFNLFQENYTIEKIGNKMHAYQSLHSLNWKLKELARKNSFYQGSFSFQPFDMRWMPAQTEFSNTNTSFSIITKQDYGLEHEWEGQSLKFSSSLRYQGEFLKSSSLGFLHRHTLAPSASIEIKMKHKNREVGIFDFTGRLDGVMGDRNLFFPAAATGFLFYLDKKKIASLKMSASNGWRAPTLSELYFVSSGYTPANNLKAEKSVSFDAGFVIKPKPFIEFGALYFFRREWDAILWRDNSSINTPQLDFNGVESWLKMVFILKKGFELSFSGNYLFNYAINSDGSRFNLTHRHIVKTNLMFAYKQNVNLTLSANYYSGFLDIEPFVELNLQARFGYDEYFLLLGIDNLLDQPLRYHQYTAPLSRAFSIGLQYRKQAKK